MATTDEYSDSSFDSYIVKVVDTGIIDYIEQKSILQSKLRELEAKIPMLQQGRVAHNVQGLRDAVNIIECKKEASQAPSEGLGGKKTVGESIKQIKHALLRIEASILQLQITVKSIEIKQKEKLVSNVSNNNNNNNNNKDGVSDIHLQQ